MNRRMNSWLVAALVCGLSLGVTSCKDDDDKLSEEEKEQQELERLEQQNNAYSVLSLLADVSAADDDFLSKTYEPTIGKEDDRDANTRIVNTNTMEAAAERFANLADVSIDENTQTYTWRDDNLGTMTYTRTNDGTSWATVDVNIKQVPHLQRIVYRAPEQAGDNGKFDGRAYYRFGDVVSREVTNKDGSTVTEYWICVRPAFGPEGKEDSHWACLNVLPQANIYSYTRPEDNFTYILPTKLGTDKENMQNLVEMLYAMLYPEEWEKNATSGTKGLKIFYDFKAANLKYHNQYFWENVCKGWDDKGIWQLALNTSKSSLKEPFGARQKTIGLLYKGYSWVSGVNCTLYAGVYGNGEGKELNMHQAEYPTIKRDVREMKMIDNIIGEDIDFRMMKYQIGFFSSFPDLKYMWICRVLKGKQLSSTGKYDKYTNIPGTKEVYRYYSDILPTNSLLDDPEVATALPRIYPPLNNAKVGCLIGADGKFYVNKESAIANGTTPVALVCTLNGTKRVERGAAWNGLAMALDVVQGSWGEEFYENMDSPCRLDYVSTIDGMSGMLNGIAATDHLVAGCGKNHVHNAAKGCRNWSAKLSDEAKATGNFSDWFLPSSGQWVLAYQGFLYPWNNQGYDMSSQVSKAENFFKEAGIQIPNTSDTYWSSTPYDKEGALVFAFNGCFTSNNTKPYVITVITDVSSIPFMAFKYNGGATQD